MLIRISTKKGNTMLLTFITKKLIINLVLSMSWIISGTVMANQHSYQLIKGVIVDNTGESIFVINPNNGLDSVSLKTGLVNWHSDHATLPVLISNGNLLAQKETNSNSVLSLISIDTKNGHQLDTKQFSLPNNTSAPIVDGLDRKFDIQANFENNPNGEITWEYNYKKVQGMLLENPPQPIKYYGKLIQDNNQTLKNMKMQIVDKPSQSTNKKIVGNFLNNLQLDSKARQFKSVNGQHILVSKLKKNTSKWNKYAWDVYDKSGNLIGSTSHYSSYTPFFVSDNVLIYVNQPNARMINNKWVESPLTLQGISLDSGQPIWDKEVRDLKFKGPYPH